MTTFSGQNYTESRVFEVADFESKEQFFKFKMVDTMR